MNPKITKLNELISELSDIIWKIDSFYDENLSEQFPHFSTSGMEIVREDLEEFVKELETEGK